MVAMSDLLRVGVFGHGNAGHLTPESRNWARNFGSVVGMNRAALYTGGGGGMMEAARRGCTDAGGSIVSVNPEGIIDAENLQSKALGSVIATGQGKLGRVHVLVQSVDLGFALGGGAGTLLEIISCYLLDKPVIVVDGFQSDRDPCLLSLLNSIETRRTDGLEIKVGYVDGKDRKQVCPITVIPSSANPEQVYKIGCGLLRERIG